MNDRARTNRPSRDSRRGFSLIELMVTLVVLGVTVLGLMVVVQSNVGASDSTVNATDARQKAAAALEMISLDLRAAGSGVDAGYTTPQLAIAYVDSLELMLCADFSGANSAPTDTLAYSPAGTPKPFKLTGGYAPPIKYRTGAELIRWTLDVNNDGAIGAADLSDANGVDSRRTPNPNDYTLVRQIYGDSLSLVASDNGGAISRIAPIRATGTGVPPLYTVSFVDGTTWNWSSGAVPAAQLKNIAEIRVQITGESARPDAKRRYARVTLSSTVSLRRFGS